jgi:hypothetical protein
MTFYTHKDVSLNLIFSRNDSDATNETMTGFKENTIALVYDTANGTISKQNNINYNATPTNYFANLSAYYIDYTYQVSQYTISVNAKCTEIRVLLCGAGGSGGGGAGDTPDNRGMSGSGGGGGAYFYFSQLITSAFTFKLTIGAGGGGVSGSGGGNSGYPGIGGGNTILYQSNGTTEIAKANGGSGGNGGHPDNALAGGAGASGGTGTLIQAGNNGSISTADRSVMLVSPGGDSGWVKSKSGTATYPKYSLSYPSNVYGTGGAGSRGEYNPQTVLSGSGENGWVRIYFIF